MVKDRLKSRFLEF